MTDSYVCIPYYEELGKEKYNPLSKEDEQVIFKKLVNARERLKREVTKDPIFQAEIQKILVKTSENLVINGSLSKLGDNFNNKVKGQNQEIHNKILKGIAKLQTTTDTKKRYKIIRSLNLKQDIFTSLAESKTKYTPYIETIRNLEHLLINSVLRLMWSVAKKYGNEVYRIEEADCIQAANEAALDAVHLYDGQTRFPTFAYVCATKRVKQWIMRNSRLIHLPQTKLERVFTVIRANKELPDELRRDTTALYSKCNELSKKHISLKQIDETLMHISGNAQPLDAPFSNKNGSENQTLVECLIDPSVDLERDYDQQRTVERARSEVFAGLSRIESTIIFLRYLDPSFLPKNNKVERKYDEVANLLGKYNFPTLSVDRIKSIELEALKKLKENSWFLQRAEEEDYES